MTNIKGSGNQIKTALLVVQRDFLAVHVGVRRVIFFYWQRLIEASYEVRLATPVDGTLFLADRIAIEALSAKSHGETKWMSPCWSCDDPVFRDRVIVADECSDPIKWSAEATDAEAHDISIITVPWLVTCGLPKARYSAGIIYDIIPNLVACGALSFDKPMNVYGFAHEHDLGNKFYIEHCDAIYPISESTLKDFIGFYRLPPSTKIQKIVPFRLDAHPQWRLIERLKRRLHVRSRKRIMLVNPFDPRKNFGVLAAVLSLIKARLDLEVIMVGRERAMPLSDVLELLANLRLSGARVEWYNNAGDQQLKSMYRRTDLLVFPSFYEGLGLPILEAQSHGVPTVSSRSPSCIEVNMNAQLCVDAADPAALAGVIISVLEDTIPHKRGTSLISDLQNKLRGWNQLPSLS